MNRINSDEYYNFSNNPTITDHAAENDRSQIPASITNTSDDRKLEIHQIDLQDTDFQRPLAHKTSINKVDEHKGTICSLIPVTDLDDPIKRTSISKSPESNREQNRMTNRSTKLNKLETNDSFIVSVGGSRTDQVKYRFLFYSVCSIPQSSALSDVFVGKCERNISSFGVFSRFSVLFAFLCDGFCVFVGCNFSHHERYFL